MTGVLTFLCSLRLCMEFTVMRVSREWNFWVLWTNAGSRGWVLVLNVFSFLWWLRNTGALWNLSHNTDYIYAGGKCGPNLTFVTHMWPISDSWGQSEQNMSHFKSNQGKEEGEKEVEEEIKRKEKKWTKKPGEKKQNTAAEREEKKKHIWVSYKLLWHFT